MLLINCAKANFISETLQKQEVGGIRFKVEAQEGFILTVSHNAPDDKTAMMVLKKELKNLPELKNMFINMMPIDRVGKLI
jgi:hypothetical protein